MDEPLKKAKEIAGGTVALARMLGIKSQAVSQWDRIPPSRVLDVERQTGISRYEQRPDIYGQPTEAAE